MIITLILILVFSIIWWFLVEYIKYFNTGDPEENNSKYWKFSYDFKPIKKGTKFSIKNKKYTTKNKAKYEEINKYLDEMEERIKEVAEKEELSKLRPPLSGDEIMDIFDLEPGPSVGIIMKALYEQRINDGEVSKEEATKLAKEVYKKL